MMRKDRIRSEGRRLRALVEAEQALEALDWCKQHQGQGGFQFLWSLEDANGTVLGLFYFEYPEDHTMFILRWG